MIRPLLCWLIWQKRTSDQDSVEIKTALIMKLLSTKYKRLLTLAVIPLIALNLADPRRVSGDETSNFGDPEQILNYHLMHPGGDSAPGDPNVAFYLDGVYHLHYIISHPWKGGKSFSYVHVTSDDMLHWNWNTTKLQPAFTGHGMYSGTGFLTKEGKPAAIYHGAGSGLNQISVAQNNALSRWETPYPLDVRDPKGNPMQIKHWDPDCFLIDDTYYAISGDENPPLLKSKDLKTWEYVGDFISHQLPDVTKGEDISCANFFRLGDKWVLLCISHMVGCRYYVGQWNSEAEQFVPEYHGRMNWRRENQSIWGQPPWRVDLFAPETLLTGDGRRVMWAWCATLDRNDGNMSLKSIQSLPRELRLASDNMLRISPLTELKSLRHQHVRLKDINLNELSTEIRSEGGTSGKKLADLDGSSYEIKIQIERKEANRKLFGVTLFSDGKGQGLPFLFRPETGTVRLGNLEAPFDLSTLPVDEDIELTIFIDKYVVEVFINDRQALITAYPKYREHANIHAFTIGAPTRIKQIDLWKLKPTNQGFLEAIANPVWTPKTK